MIKFDLSFDVCDKAGSLGKGFFNYTYGVFMQVVKLRRAVIKEELYAITGSSICALLLNQFLFWCDRMNDVDQYIAEESARIGDNPNIELSHGWVYKKATELKDEIMSDVGERTILSYIDKLINLGFISRRNNPTHKYDRTFQYRVNYINIQNALIQAGYTLEGYKIINIAEDTVPSTTANFAVGSADIALETADIALHSDKNCGAIPYTTTYTTTKNNIYTQKLPTEDIADSSEQHMQQFNAARMIFGGVTRGLNTEFNNFRKKHKDWPKVIPLLIPAIELEIEVRKLAKDANEFYPAWKNFTTWINNRCWEAYESNLKKRESMLISRSIHTYSHTDGIQRHIPTGKRKI